MESINPILLDQKLGELWAIVIVLAVTSYFAMRWRTWLAGVIIVIAALLSLLMFLELSDPASSVGMELDLGRGYVVHTKIASAALFLLPVATATWARRKKRSVV